MRCVPLVARAAGLFDDEAHRVRFVHQAQLAGPLGMAVVPWIQEDPAALDDAMDVGDHGRDPAHVVVLAAGPFAAAEAFVDVTGDRWCPAPTVRHVDRELRGVGRNLQVLLGQQEAPGVAIEREHLHAVSDRDDEQRLRSVQRVAGAHLASSGLQERAVRDRPVARRGEYGEDRSDRYVDVDVARAVEGIEEQQEVAARVGHRDAVRVIHLLGGHRREVAAPFVRFHEDLVGEHVELGLRLALHVGRADRSEHVAERTATDGIRDRLAGARDGLEQKPQLGIQPVVALATDQIVGQRDSTALHSGDRDVDAPRWRDLGPTRSIARSACTTTAGNGPRGACARGSSLCVRRRCVARALRSSESPVLRLRADHARWRSLERNCDRPRGTKVTVGPVPTARPHLDP